MNSYPSCIPEIEALALFDREWIDRELAERVFDLRKTAAFQLLRRMAAQRCGTSLVIGRFSGGLSRWKPDAAPKSLVPVDAGLAKQMEELRTVGLPETIHFMPQ